VIDVGGLAFLLKTPLGALMRAGQQTFGKGSKLTVKELTNNEEFMQNYLKQNPNAIKDLEQYGFDIQKRYMTGKKKRGPTPRERDEGMTIFGGEDIRVPPAARAASDKERIEKLEEIADKSPDFIDVFAGVDQKLLDAVEKAKQKKIKESELNLTKGGIEKKEGAGKGQNQNVELTQNTLKQKQEKYMVSKLIKH